jgi:hypothetical protein
MSAPDAGNNIPDDVEAEAEVRAIWEEIKPEVYALAEAIKAYRRELTGVAAPSFASIEPEVVKAKAEALRAARRYRRLYKQYRQRRADEERLAGLVWERREINYLATTKYRGKRNAVACARKEVAEDRGIDAESIKPSHARIRRRFRGGVTHRRRQAVN